MGTSLSQALFTRTQGKVLGILFGDPGRAFNATEMFALAEVGRGSVQRELARLVESGVVVVTRRGNQKLYQANAAAPIFEELRAIVRKTTGLAEPLREALAPVADRIDLALVYGSVARGEDRAASDIDLLVVGEIPLEDLHERLHPLEASLGRTVNPTLYTREEYEARRRSGHPFLEKVLAGESIPIVGRPE